jgi:hypothetical protein
VSLMTLSADELRARAAELDNMARTARTADTRDALRRLASRYAHLAQARGSSEDESADLANGWLAPGSGSTDHETTC